MFWLEIPALVATKTGKDVRTQLETVLWSP